MGKFSLPFLQENIEPFTEGFNQVFENYKQETNPYLDNVGLRYLSCEILKDLGVRNPFGHKKRDNTLCWDGRLLSEYLLSYVRRFLSLERLRFTFTPNSKREFVPRDQVFPLIVVYCLLVLQKK